GQLLGDLRDLGRDVDGKTAGDDHQEGADHHDGQIVGEFAKPRTRAHFPDVIEGFFDVAEDLDGRPEKQNDADAGNQPSLCICQQGAGKIDNLLDGRFLAGQTLVKLFFQTLFQSESFGQAKG